MIEVYPHKRFRGVYWISAKGEERVATRNLALGRKVYGEKLVKVKGIEYRIWDPFRSKLSAAILKGMKELSIKPNLRVLYLGVATGTTASHISDIIGKRGILYGVDFAPRIMREFIDNVCAFRRNIVPILADARFPKAYRMLVGPVDVIYCDVAQPRQADILIDNAKFFLKEEGRFLLAVKARSIDVVKRPSRVYEREISILEREEFKIDERISLEPYSKDHLMVTGRKKS